MNSAAQASLVETCGPSFLTSRGRSTPDQRQFSLTARQRAPLRVEHPHQAGSLLFQRIEPHDWWCLVAATLLELRVVAGPERHRVQKKAPTAALQRPARGFIQSVNSSVAFHTVRNRTLLCRPAGLKPQTILASSNTYVPSLKASVVPACNTPSCTQTAGANQSLPSAS